MFGRDWRSCVFKKITEMEFLEMFHCPYSVIMSCLDAKNFTFIILFIIHKTLRWD